MGYMYEPHNQVALGVGLFFSPLSHTYGGTALG